MTIRLVYVSCLLLHIQSQTRMIPRLKSFTPLARAGCAAHRRSPKRIEHALGGYRPTKLESNRSIGLACSLKK